MVVLISCNRLQRERWWKQRIPTLLKIKFNRISLGISSKTTSKISYQKRGLRLWVRDVRSFGIFRGYAQRNKYKSAKWSPHLHLDTPWTLVCHYQLIGWKESRVLVFPSNFFFEGVVHVCLGGVLTTSITPTKPPSNSTTRERHSRTKQSHYRTFDTYTTQDCIPS